MKVENPLHDRQPKPAPRCLHARRSIETTTDVRALLGWNAGACISNRYAHVGGSHLHVHVDLRAGRAVPNRVVNHVSEENREKPGVAEDEGVTPVVERNVHVLREGDRCELADGRGDHQHHVDGKPHEAARE